MTESEHEPVGSVHPTGVNPGYAAFQIAKALVTSERHDNAATRQRAQDRIAKWVGVFQNIVRGSVDYGSRTPVEGVPPWATLEVVTGGFATGQLLAAGPLQEHERQRLDDLRQPDGPPRRALNAHFLTDEGLAELRNWLRTGRYDVDVPEEGALLVVAWLAENGHAAQARELLDRLSPFFRQLRFYPIPLEEPRRFGSRVHFQDVRSTIDDLRKIKPNQRILAQKEAVEVWAPFQDRVVSLFLETAEDGWPCRTYSPDWKRRANALLADYVELRKQHNRCGKPERPREHLAQLRAFLTRCAAEPKSLTGCEVGRIRLILRRYLEKRGAPDAPQCAAARDRQTRDVSGPTFHQIAGVVAPRLAKYPLGDGLDDVGHLTEPVSNEESAGSGIPEGAQVPCSIRRKVERCLNDTVSALVERGLITSGDTLARILPQMTSGLRAVGIADPTLRQLYAAIYRAFRRRRSLLLLNLEKQVQIEELPWIAAIDRFRSENLTTAELARQTLEEVSLLTITSFPHAILPNKLLQELRSLAMGAGLDIPLIDEVAADIFQGAFSDKFRRSATKAADLLGGTLYATYYAIDYELVRKVSKARDGRKRTRLGRASKPGTDGFARLCAARAGVPLGTWDPATNGMIIEQQQIVTSQNLAALFLGLDLTDAMRDRLGDMAQACFRWVCRRHQMKIDKWHARLIMLKNTAYAWRQMVFFLALLPNRGVVDFLRWAEEHLDEQSAEFRLRFGPALGGLSLAADGCSIDSDRAAQSGARRFLGWSKSKHWLLTECRT